MNDTDVSQAASTAVLDRLSAELDELTPEAQKAARYVLENPRDVGVSTVREIAEAAQVKPNTIVRMARQVGFQGYEDFRQPFREALRRGEVSFTERAEWLQSVAAQGGLGSLLAEMVESALNNIEETFARIDESTLRAAAEAIWRARRVYVLGVGVNNANAQNFAYLASTGMVEFHAIPRAGAAAADEIVWADVRDVLIAITCHPYRTEVVETVRLAKEQGLAIIALSDSPVSPIIRAADHGFVLSVDTPQFFPSSVSTIALLETLLSFVIATASPEIVERVEAFHTRRHALGFYQDDPK